MMNEQSAGVIGQVRQGLGVGQVVDTDDLDVRALGDNRTEEVTTNAAEPVDAYPDRHEPISSLVHRRCTPTSWNGMSPTA